MANQKDTYGFITNSGQAKKSLPLPGLNSKTGRLAWLAGGAILLLLLIWLIVSLIFGGGTSNKQQLINLVKEQNEIVRVATIATKDARSPQASNLANTARLTLSTQQKDLTAALAKQKIKVNAKELASGKNVATDTKLTTAKQNNRFDETFISTMQTQLKTYQNNLKTTYENVQSNSLKKQLSDFYDEVTVIIKTPSIQTP